MAIIAYFTFFSSNCFLFILTTSEFALASIVLSFEGTTVFRCDIASEGTIRYFDAEMFSLIARRRWNFVKLMLSSVY